MLLFLCNEHLLYFTRFADGVNWLYLPSGLRLTLVLVFGWPAALGIAWSSALITAWPQALPGAWPQALVTGVISGFAPWLAMMACRHMFKLSQDLAGLQARTLLTLAVMFAVTSAGVHQLWYGWRDPSADRVLQFTVMALGDLAGSLVVLYAGQWALRKWILRS